jgi:Spy/CpxP family protein refolding chaperone
MKHISIILLLIAISIASLAQPNRKKNPNRQEQLEKVHAVKVSYLSDRLKLTSKQAEQFWPVYNEYESEMQEIRKKYFQKYKDADKKNDEVARNLIDDNLDFQQDALNIKRKYKERFLSVISSEQLVKLNASEKEFNKLIQHRLMKKREKMQD